MKDTISQLCNQCLREFTALTDSKLLFRYETEVSHRRWLDELGRLRVWSGNIGAHQTGQSSLGYRLRDASHLREETTRLLSRILQIVQDVSEVINEGDEEAFNIEIEDDEEINGMTEVQQLYQSITDTINLLFQISMAIRRPADHDRLLNIKINDNSYFEPWARQHVSHKYPEAEDALVSRLGTAMARQKSILKYRERHRAKLGKGLFGDMETTSTKLSETVATEIPCDNDHLQFLDTASNSGFSQTSYATSLMEGKMATSMPKPPKASSDRSPFECPYCFHVIVVKHKRDWARHVFRDVMPYVCLSMNCATPSRLYESRHQWFSHMREAHVQGQNELECPLCHADIQVLSSFEKHVGRHLEELALFFLPSIDVEEEASDAAPSVLSMNRNGSESIANLKHPDSVDAESPGLKPSVVIYGREDSVGRIDSGGMSEDEFSASSRTGSIDAHIGSRSDRTHSNCSKDDLVVTNHPETAFDSKLTQAQEYQDEREKSKGLQERPIWSQPASWVSGEDISGLEDDGVSGDQEGRYIGATQHPDVDAVTEESEVPKPSISIRRKSDRNNPRVVQIIQTGDPREILGNATITHRRDMREDTSEERSKTRDPGYHEYAHTTHDRRPVYREDPGYREYTHTKRDRGTVYQEFYSRETSPDGYLRR